MKTFILTCLTLYTFSAVAADSYKCTFSGWDGAEGGSSISATFDISVGESKIVKMDPTNPYSPAVQASVEVNKGLGWTGYIGFDAHFITDSSQFDEKGMIGPKFQFGYTSATAVGGTERVSAMSGRSNQVEGDSYSLQCFLNK